MVGCCKQRLRGHPSRILKASIAGNNVDYGIKRFQRTVLATRLEAILVCVTAFCPCPKNFPGVTLRGNALIY